MIRFNPMFFVQFEATPRREARSSADAAGAYVNCWIERSTLEEAIRVARCSIEAEGWIVDDPDEAFPVDASDYPDGHPGREYFEQAMVDKQVFVFHCFPEVDDEWAGE